MPLILFLRLGQKILTLGLQLFLRCFCGRERRDGRFIHEIVMKVRIEESWRQVLQEEFDKPYFAKLVNFVKCEYAHYHVLPEAKHLFEIFSCANTYLKANGIQEIDW